MIALPTKPTPFQTIVVKPYRNLANKDSNDNVNKDDVQDDVQNDTHNNSAHDDPVEGFHRAEPRATRQRATKHTGPATRCTRPVLP